MTDDINECESHMTNQEIIYCIQDDLSSIRATFEGELENIELEILKCHTQLSRLHTKILQCRKEILSRMMNLMEEKIEHVLWDTTEKDAKMSKVREKWDKVGKDD